MESENGLFVKSNLFGYTKSYRINNGIHEISSTWHSQWHLLKGATEITSIEKLKKGERTNYRWGLKDPDDNELKLPIELTVEEADEKYDNDGYEYYIGSECKYHKYSFLYKRIWDTLPDEWVEVKYEIQNKGKLSVNEVDNFSDMKVKLSSTSIFSEQHHETKLSDIVTYSELESMLTPPLAIHNRPCSLSSHNTYRIIRAYVKDNIDNKYAKIDSDYDFCFGVSKVIPVKPYVRKTEIFKSNGKSYAKPRFNKKTISTKQQKIFEMTHAQNKHRGYTVIDGFVGDNLKDLQTQIKVYLDELMERINEPLIECPHCDGYGHIIKKEG